MARSRLGVALLVRPPLDREVDALRAACGDGALRRIAPHVTLVPPVNVRSDALDEALDLVRVATSAARPLRLALGPPTTFGPDSPTLYLAVGPPPDGHPEALDRLVALRAAVFQGPLHRPRALPFVPHVTLADGMGATRRDAGITALADYRATASFDSVHVLEERHLGAGERRWVPIADHPLARPAVVGRGGLPLEVATSTLLEPAAARFEAHELGEQPTGPGVVPPAADGSGEPDGETEPRLEPDTRAAGDGPGSAVVVVARRRGDVVGVARGRRRLGGPEVASVLVAREDRGQGIGCHLLAALDHAGTLAAS